MKQLMRWLLVGAVTVAATAAWGTFHTFQIQEIFSNADGTIQYVVLHEALGMNGQNLLSGHMFTATQGMTMNTYEFPSDLPGGSCDYFGCTPSPTANRHVLIATQGFAALGIVAPDYVIPNGFLPLSGTINYAGVDQVSYGSLPTDGVRAIDRTGAVISNLATNFAGQSASVSVPASVNPDLNQHGLTGSWFKPASTGQGFQVEVFPDMSPGMGFITFSWYTYDATAGGADHQRWYTASGPAVSGQPNASLTIYQNTGGNFNAPPITSAQPVGTATLSFDTCTSGKLSYSFTDGTGRMGTILLTRLTQNVTCSTTAARPTNADFALSGNWFAPATSGQGFTAEVNPNSGALASAWYTYAPNGALAGAAGQRWYSAQGSFTPGMRSIPVTIYETTGGMFDQPTPPGQTTVPVGTGTMAFQSCSAATFSYSFSGGSSTGLSGTIVLSRVGPVPPGCT